MITLPNGIKKLEDNDNATVENFNANAELLDDHIGAGGTAHSPATTTKAGFQSAADKTKLDSISAGANNYTHPATHPAAIIAQDASNRFVTDAEKAAWNLKASKAGDTMTGPLVLPANPTANLQAATKQYVDTADALLLPKAGGTMTGPLQINNGGAGRQVVANSWSDVSANASGYSLFANNAYTDGALNYRYSNTHSNLGARGIKLSPSSDGIEYFDTGPIATVAGAIFTPVWKKIWTGMHLRDNDGNLEFYTGGEWKSVAMPVMVASNTARVNLIGMTPIQLAVGYSFILVAKWVPPGTGEIMVAFEANGSSDGNMCFYRNLERFTNSGGDIFLNHYLQAAWAGIDWRTPIGTKLADGSNSSAFSQFGYITPVAGMNSTWKSYSGMMRIHDREPILFAALFGGNAPQIRNFNIFYDLV